MSAAAAVLDAPPPVREVAAEASLELVRIGGAAAVAAGVVHIAAVAAHSNHRQAATAFIVVAVAELVWGAAAAVRPTRRLAGVGALLATIVLAAWAVAKTTGLPFIDGLTQREPVRAADAIVAGLAAVSLVACAVALLARRIRPPKTMSIAVAAALLVVAVPGTASGLNLSHGGPGAVAAAVPPKTFDPTLPIDLSGVPGVSLQQQARAENLLSITVTRLPKFADPAVAEANGFRSIRDGATGVEHYLNPTFINDDVMLDPDRPESLVYDTTVTPKRLVAAMYMATPGTTLATVPDIGGPLTQWHIHNNLCFNSKGQVAGLVQGDGSCRAPLVQGAETPMIHVWIVPRRCGPFSALEGIGGGQIKDGETVACDAVHGA